MFEKIAEFRKAIAAFLVPGLAVLGTALIPDADGKVVVTAAEWVQIAIASLGTGVAVTAIPNAVTTKQATAVADGLGVPASAVKAAEAGDLQSGYVIGVDGGYGDAPEHRA